MELGKIKFIPDMGYHKLIYNNEDGFYLKLPEIVIGTGDLHTRRNQDLHAIYISINKNFTQFINAYSTVRALCKITAIDIYNQEVRFTIFDKEDFQVSPYLSIQLRGGAFPITLTDTQISSLTYKCKVGAIRILGFRLGAWNRELELIINAEEVEVLPD